MSEVIVDGVRYLPMKRKTTKNRRPLNVLLVDGRKVRRETLAEAAKRIGTTKSHLWELEKGSASNPCLDLLQRLLNYYGIDFDEIADING